MGAGLDEDFKQLSEEAPSEGLTTIPTETDTETGKKLDSVYLTECGLTCAILRMYGILTWRVALVETGRHFSKSMSTGSGGGREQGPQSLCCLLLLQVPGSHLFADARLEQAVG